ncbi:RDD family protein [Pedobacter sp. SG918]|uniref:RDD family protein n=1 Tax=Pedobacter sp. SG918 TaxID=2587136 RepID=UPI00146EB2FD|nr:RDD family protein [Pedobacter sp. SG918]NMN37531.1 hypothetical protein [Pedobacter sp. SG918]
MQKIKSKLAIFVILTALYELTVEFLPSFLQARMFYAFFNPFYFSFRIKQVFSYETLNQLFTILFLISGILYYLSKGNESRLLRCLFSVILIDRLVRVFNLFLLTTFSFSSFTERTSVANILLAAIGNIAWAYVSFRILKDFNVKRKLSTKTEDYGGDIVTYFVEANNWQRVFHLIIDSFLLLIIFYPIIESVTRIEIIVSLLNKVSFVIGEKPTLYLICACFLLIYYLFFENLFQSSPAKFLTETRVVKQTEGPFNFKTIFVRTVSRLIPFDAFSFVLANTGWHDRLSGTAVLKEEDTGAKGWKYLFVIPAAVILLFLIGYIDTEARFYFENRSIGNKLEDKIDSLTVDDFIKFGNVKNSNTILYLKPERINGSEITCSVITMDNEYEYHPEKENIDVFYLKHKNIWPSISLNKDKLIKGLPDNFVRAKDGSSEGNGKGIMIKNIEGNYVLLSIEPYMQPVLDLENVNVLSGQRFIFSILNKGWKVKILKIEASENHIDWTISDSTIRDGRFGATISGLKREPTNKVNAKLIVQDTVGKIYTYNISTEGNSGAITKIK